MITVNILRELFEGTSFQSLEKETAEKMLNEFFFIKCNNGTNYKITLQPITNVILEKP